MRTRFFESWWERHGASGGSHRRRSTRVRAALVILSLAALVLGAVTPAAAATERSQGLSDGSAGTYGAWWD